MTTTTNRVYVRGFGLGIIGCAFLGILLGGNPSVRAEATALCSPSPMQLDLALGVYFPGPYYSRAYLQDFPLLPNQQYIYFRLRPYQNYARHRFGEAFPPLTDGDIHADFLPYRYNPFFQAPQAILPGNYSCAPLSPEIPIGRSRERN